MAAPGTEIALPSNPDQNEGPYVLGATISVTAIALITVVLRLYVRFGMLRSFGWDDAFMTLAMALSLSGLGVVIGQVQHGAGRHIGDVDPNVYMTGMKLNFVSQPIFLIVICVVKLAVGASLLRITSTRFWRYLILSIMYFMAFYTTGCFFTIMFQCTDIRVLWNTAIKSTCWDQRTLQSLSYTNVALNILTDLLFAIVIPTPMLWKLNVNRRARVTLFAILGLGTFGCAAAVIKIGYLVNYGLRGDWLWDSRNITIWTVVESNVGIVAGSLPCLRPLFRTVFGSIYGSGSRSRGGPTRGGGASGKAYAVSGNRRSGNRWQTLPSKPGDDEAGSERGLNVGGDEAFEMVDQARKMGMGGVTTVVVDGNSSSDSLATKGLGATLPGRDGIRKTTTTTMTYSK
ncbi:hypothetical protein F5Y15DRAFT_270203 [Xylariaceae sp. FL0016]|nr:hypothetical protein F5Y15DRAFT_270203 [Xylariaceae sp. FL0016]